MVDASRATALGPYPRGLHTVPLGVLRVRAAVSLLDDLDRCDGETDGDPIVVLVRWRRFDRLALRLGTDGAAAGTRSCPRHVARGDAVVGRQLPARLARAGARSDRDDRIRRRGGGGADDDTVTVTRF